MAHGLLGTHEDPPSVDVGGEGDALLLDVPQGGQGEHLEAPGVGEDGAVPGHHLVEPPQGPDHLVPRPEVEVVGVAQLDLTLELLQVQGAERRP